MLRVVFYIHDALVLHRVLLPNWGVRFSLSIYSRCRMPAQEGANKLFQSQRCASINCFVNNTNSIKSSILLQSLDVCSTEEREEMSESFFLLPFDSAKLKWIFSKREKVFSGNKIQICAPHTNSPLASLLSCFNNFLIFRNEIRLLRKEVTQP